MDYELEVTDNAISKVFGIINSDDDYSPETTLFRVVVRGKTGDSYEYGMGLEFKKDDYDTSEFFFDLEKFKMIIDEESLIVLDGATIDYKEDLNAEGFMINNPNKPQMSEIEQRITEHLDATINPQIASHGGKIDVIRVDGSTLLIEMKGGCQGCSSSGTTLQYGVEQQILSQFPEITRIDDVTSHEDGENPYYS